MELVVLLTLTTIIFPLIASFIAPFLRKFEEGIHFYASVVAIITWFFAFAALLTGWNIASVTVWTFPWIKSFNIKGGIYLDRFALLMLTLVSFIGMLIVIYSHDYMHDDKSLHRYYFFILFFIANMLGVVVSDNLLQMFIFWEGVGLASYALIGFWNTINENVKSGNKAFLVTKMGDAGLLAAIILIYYNVQTMNFSELSELGSILGKAHLIVPVGLLMFAGIAGKSAQFPLQFWLPEAMAGPSTVSALIHAATMVKAGVYLIGRISPFFLSAPTKYEGQLKILFMVIAGVGIFTAFFAGSIGMAARELKKILAFSTISQLGYMIGGIGVGALLFNGQEATFAGIFHMTTHMAFKALLFLGAGVILHALSNKTKDIFEIGGIGKKMPQTAIIFTIGALSLSGIPPLSGFFSKESIFRYLSLYSRDSMYGVILFITAIIAAIFTFFYSLRLIGVIFTGEPSEYVQDAEKEGHLKDPSFFMLVPLYALATLSVLWGFFGGFVEQWLNYKAFSGHEALVWIGEVFSSPIGWLVVITVIIIGGIPAYLFYFKKIDNSFISRSFLQKFLYKRWYWNVLMLKTFVDGSYAIGNAFDRIQRYFNIADKFAGKAILTASDKIIKFDEKIVDGSVNGLARFMRWLGKEFSKLEIGQVTFYLWVGLAGFAILLAIVLIILLV